MLPAALGGDGLGLAAEVPSHPGLRPAGSAVPSASVPSGIHSYEPPLFLLACPSRDSYASWRDSGLESREEPVTLCP